MALLFDPSTLVPLGFLLAPPGIPHFPSMGEPIEGVSWVQTIANAEAEEGAWGRSQGGQEDPGLQEEFGGTLSCFSVSWCL